MSGPNAPYTKLDHQQVLTQVFDESTDRLRVDAAVTAEVSSMEISADVSDIAIEDRISGNQMAVEADGSINANVVLDAASDTVRIGDGVTNANVTVANALKTDSSHVTQPVSASSLPLPSGAATEAKQNDANNTLDAIYTELQNKADATENQSVTSFGVIDTNNSTSTPLSGSASFTGTASDMLEYGSLSIKVFADQDSTLDGLKLQFSANGTDWDDTVDFNILANVGRSFIVPVLARYFRVKFDNGSSPQSIFRLQVIKRAFAHGTIQTPLDSRVLDQDLAVLSRSVLTAKQPSGLYTNISSTSGGNLKVSVEEFDTSLPAGTNNIGDVDVVSSVLPTGAATEAKQDDIISELQDIESEVTRNIREKVVNAADVVQAYTWLDFGAADERLSTVVYTSATYPSDTITKTFAYTFTSGAYRLDSITWTVT